MTAQTELPQVPSTKVVQITNIAPQATKDQMQTLFGFLGKIEDIRLYPTIRDVSVPVQSRICYVKFFDAVCVGVAQHMTNTVFIDRALIVTPYVSSTNEIPDEYRALEIAAQANVVPGLYGNNSKLPPHVTNQIEGVQPNQVITTHDPVLISNGLPPYPPLPINYDSVRIEEIRRTVVASNIDSNITAQQLIDFFGTAGDVKYVRFCTRENDPNKYALVEFSEQSSIITALKMNGSDLLGRSVQISHSTVNIDKPQAKSNEAAQREIEEAMTRVKEAQNLISAAIDPVIGILSKDKKRRSRSRSRRRSRSRSRGRRRRSRSRSRGRRRRSRSRKRSRSRSRKRSRSRDRKKRSRDRRRSKSRSRSKSRGRSRKSRSRSRSKRNEKTKSNRHKDDKKERDKDKESRSKDSPSKNDNKDSVKSSVEKDLVLDGQDKEIVRDGSKSPEKRSPSTVRRSRSRSRRESRSTSRKRTPPRKKSHSPIRKKSRSPSRKKSRSPSRKKSHSPSRKKKQVTFSKKKQISIKEEK
uniref:Putative splicing factor arginine/serine-rich n=1 Tax=Panstrongylus lignarius TaxID=156445 RepID=A0A224XNB6_9HEMI